MKNNISEDNLNNDTNTDANSIETDNAEADNTDAGYNAKSILIGVILGVLVAAATAVGVVFFLTNLNGGNKTDLSVTADNDDKEESGIQENLLEEETAGEEYITFSGDYSIIKGVNNNEQLAYLLGIAEACKDNDWNKLSYALGEIWYEKAVSGVYSNIDSEAASENKVAYSIDELNSLYSFITDEGINESNIPTMAVVSGNELIYKYNGSVSASKFQVVIKGIKYKESDKMYIEYLYKIVTSVNGDGGIYGQSIALCEPDENGEYRLISIESQFRKKYVRNQIDEDFLAEFQ